MGKKGSARLSSPEFDVDYYTFKYKTRPRITPSYEIQPFSEGAISARPYIATRRGGRGRAIPIISTNILSRARPMSSIIPKNIVRARIRPVLDVIPIQPVKVDITPRQRQATDQRIIPIPRLFTQQTSITPGGGGGFRIPPPTPPPKIIIPRGGSRRIIKKPKKKKSPSYYRPFKYTASIVPAQFGIRGKRQKVLTGVSPRLLLPKVGRF